MSFEDDEYRHCFASVARDFKSLDTSAWESASRWLVRERALAREQGAMAQFEKDSPQLTEYIEQRAQLIGLRTKFAAIEDACARAYSTQPAVFIDRLCEILGRPRAELEK